MKQKIIWRALLTLIVCTWPVAVTAHGGGTPKLTNVEAGPYQLYLWSSPEPQRAGEVHFSVAVTQPQTKEDRPDITLEKPILDATVQIRLQPLNQEGQEIDLVATRGNMAVDVYYEADTEIPEPGEWQVSVSINGPDGSGHAEYTEEILAKRRVNWRWLAGIGFTLMVIVVLGRIYPRKESSRSRGAVKSIAPK